MDGWTASTVPNHPLMDSYHNSSSVDLTPLWHSPYHPALQALIWIVATLLCLETIVGNAMVIIAYKLERSISKQVNNRYIVSLAVSDLIIGIEGIPLFTVYVVNGDRWPLGSIACETWLFLDYTLCLVSILTVLLITADRYMSVCHTAKYLKWQSPTKTQVLIIFSWVLPALMFGVMIYGWSFLSGEERAEHSTECSAPFLSNPYVNMGMYVAYYWTTLIAMLILYKGIHKAAKNLEKKAKAKEHRHIALLLTQRLGTQVGVSLMLQSKRNDSVVAQTKDSGYHTVTSSNTNSALPNNMPTNMNNQELSHLIEEVRTEARIAKKTHILKREPLSLTRSSSPNQSLKRRQRKRSSVRSAKSIPTPALEQQPRPEFAQPLVLDSDDIIETKPSSDNTVVPESQKIFKSGSKFNGWDELAEDKIPMAVAESVETPLENGYKAYNVQVTHSEHRHDSWIDIFSTKIHWWTRRGKRRRSSRRRSSKKMTRSHSVSSTDSDSSSMDSPKHTNTPRVPSVTVTRDKRTKHSVDSQQSIDPQHDMLGPAPTNSQRKASNISSFTKDTKDRMISSLFAPISTALNRSRKRTKAERRAHKAFRTITFIVGLFAILWSPYYVVATVYGFCKGTCIPSLLYNLSYYMCYLNSSGNPFAYALANRQFRTAFLRMLRGNFRRVP